MGGCSAVCVRSSSHISLALVALMLSAAVGAANAQLSTSARLREGGLPAQIPQAFGGGDVMLELTVDPGGAVTRIERIRATPPYADFVAAAAAKWRFEPATVMTEERAAPVSSSVLVIAVFRPPSFYAGRPGVSPQEPAAPSPRMPRVESVVMPAYPPTAIGDGIVMVEIEMSSRAKPRGYRIVGPASGFDAAALDAVRAWRFGAPQAVDAPDRLFVYALLGFRVPLAPVTPRRE